MLVDPCSEIIVFTEAKLLRRSFTNDNWLNNKGVLIIFPIFLFLRLRFFSLEVNVSFSFTGYSFKSVNLRFFHIFLVNRILHRLLTSISSFRCKMIQMWWKKKRQVWNSINVILSVTQSAVAWLLLALQLLYLPVTQTFHTLRNATVRLQTHHIFMLRWMIILVITPETWKSWDLGAQFLAFFENSLPNQ